MAKNTTSHSQNSHFFNLAKSSFFLSIYNTRLKWSSCPSSLWEYTKMPSINTTTNLSKKGLKTRFIKSIKAARAFGLMRNSYCPNRVLKAVLSSGLIWSWWYPNYRSIFEYTLDPWSWLNKSSILGNGYFFLTLTLLRSRLSTQRQSRMKPFSN